MPLELSLGKIAEMLHGELKGSPDRIVRTISPPEKPAHDSISPLWEKKFIPAIAPSAVLLTKQGWIPEGREGVEVDDPRRSLVALLKYFDPSAGREYKTFGGAAAVSPDARIGDGVTLGPGCVVSDGASIGDKCVLMANVYVGRDVSIGSGSLIEPGAALYDRVRIGRNCIIHANAVIGCDGFGFMPDPDTGLLRIPQIGTTVVGDNVEIGVCASIDRATFGETVIASGVKIDSHVKVGHNCQIGEFSIIVAQSGLAGSSRIGRGVIFAAQSGIGNHASVGDGVTVAGRAGVVNDIPSGSTVSGFPAIDHKQDLRRQAALGHVPDLLKEIKELKAKLEKLETKD